MIRNFFSGRFSPTTIVLARRTGLVAALGASLALAPGWAFSPGGALAQDAKPKPAKPAPAKAAKATPAKKPEATPSKKPEQGGAGKPLLVATSGEWGAYTAGAAKAKTCYALSKPKERLPASLKRDPGYLFISNRPGEGVKNEISFVMGFEVKADSSPTADIATENFPLVAKGSNLWVANVAKEPQFIDALRKGQRLVVKAQSKKGNASTDTYTLAGIGQMLDRASKDCQ